VQTLPTIVVTSSLTGSFADTDFIEVDPAGVLVSIFGLSAGGTGIVQTGTGQKTVTANVYGDAVPAQGVTFQPLTASGFACPTVSGANICGTLGALSTLPGTAPTVQTVPYTPPAVVPAPPYNRPMVDAYSVLDGARSSFLSFLLSASAPPANTGLRIPAGLKFNSAVTGGSVRTVVANVANDTGTNRSVNWTLTAAGAPCSTCGTLGTPTPTGNGTFVSSTITYTPPAIAPTGTALTPTITATSADGATATDSFTFTIADGACGKGNEIVLNGQYAFFVRGGGANVGYSAVIASFIADGTGQILGGSIDDNTSTGSDLCLTIQQSSSSASSYSVGADNRVCLTLADSNGGVRTFRASVGSLVAGKATRGRIIRFDDNNGRRPRQSGILLQQNSTSFSTSQFSGNYVSGFTGVSNGHQDSSAGIITADGTTGNITAITEDEDVAGSGPVSKTGTGTYALDATGNTTGRGTATITLSGQTTKLVYYMVSSSEILAMTTDSVNTSSTVGLPLMAGELRRQTGPFTATSLDNKGYVFYLAGIDPANGGNNTFIGQSTFTTNGSSTTTVDQNDNGVMPAEQSGTVQFTVATTGRVTLSGSAVGTNPPILYMIDANSGFMVGTDSFASFGYAEAQTGGLSSSSLSGPYFFGGDAPTTQPDYQSGTITLDGAGNINGNGDISGPGGLSVNPNPINGGTYSFSNPSTPQGLGTVGTNSLAYIISGSKVVFMSTGSSPEVFTVQQ
jgi:hypothetical protein